MANPYPAEFQTTSRDGRGLIVRIGGVLDFTDPSNQPGGGGSGNLTIQGSIDNRVDADSPTTVTMNGSPTAVDLIVASPPAWLDSSGNITAAGMYAVGLDISIGVAPTSTGLYAVVSMVFAAITQVNVDAISVHVPTVTDSGTIITGDLPYKITQAVYTQSDPTGTLSVTPFAAQLASVS